MGSLGFDRDVQERGGSGTALRAAGAGVYDAVVVAVGHREFVETGVAGVRALGKDGAVLYDVKGIFGKDETDGRL